MKISHATLLRKHTLIEYLKKQLRSEAGAQEVVMF